MDYGKVPMDDGTSTVHDRTPQEERYNTLTHIFGFGLSLAGAIAMLPVVVIRGEPMMIVACAVYLLSLMAVYASSALSHAFADPSKREFYRKLDQAFIYILIVASFTPFSVRYLDGTWWWYLLGLMWVIAIAGFLSKLMFSHRVNSVSVWLYLALGWVPVIGGIPFTDLLPTEVFLSIILGGVFYTGGTVFLFNDRKSIYFHPIWHLFVVAGSAAHYFGILWYVI